MELVRKTRKEFLDLYRMGAFTCVVATQDEVTKSWRLFALNKKGIAVFIEKARGGIREWAGLNYVADFCAAIGDSSLGSPYARSKVTKIGLSRRK